MPKESVYSDQLPFDASARSVAEITWSREAEQVQIVTKCVDVSTGGRFTAEATTGTVVADINYTDGFYVTLDRRGINDLIRKLRRARDQAFGRDE